MVEDINPNFNEIILHCSATVENQNFDIKDIELWHKKRGFSEIGYHFFIKLNGTIQKGRSLKKIGAHCKAQGKNHTSIGICYAGGDRVDDEGNEVPADTRTEAQKKAIDKLLLQLKRDYPQLKKLSGHNDYENKACPCFNVKKEYSHLSYLFTFNN